MKTELILFKDGVGYNIDLKADVSLPLTFSIDTINDISKRGTTYSRTFIIPGTKSNNQFFNHIYSINSNSDFDPNIKTTAQIKSDGLTFAVGVLCLDEMEVKLNDGENYIEYSATFYGNIIDIKSRLGDLKISDLDFSAYDHTWDIDRVWGSWFDDITINGVTGQTNRQNTYTSPTVTSTLANVVVGGRNHPKITFSAPHTFIPDDEVFVNVTNGGIPGSYSYDQEVLSVPSNTEIVLKTTSPTAFSGGGLAGRVTKEMLSGFGYWYPCVDYGTYMGKMQNTEQFIGNVYYHLYSYDPADDFTNVGGTNTEGEVFAGPGGFATNFTNSIVYALKDIADDAAPLSSKNFDDLAIIWEIHDFVPHIFLREVLLKTFEFLGYTWDCDIFDSKMFRRCIIPMKQNILNPELGPAFDMNDWLPDTKLIDVLSSCINMFNLAIIENPYDPTVITFRNRGEVFASAPISWTDKLVENTGLRVSFLNKDASRIYAYNYKEGSDFYSQDYKDDWGQEYGGGNLIEINSDFLKNISTTEIIFEPSVFVSYSGINLTASFGGTNEEATRDISDRVLLAGLRNCSEISLVSGINPSYTKVKEGVYGYGGHMDNFNQEHPSHDLNWTKPDGVYFTGNTALTPTIVNDSDWDENALFNKYWFTYMDKLTNQRARIITAFMRLSIMDIRELDFMTMVQAGPYVMRINKINDWDINGDGVCKCEFLNNT